MSKRLIALKRLTCLLVVFLSLSTSKMFAGSYQSKIDEYIGKESSIIINANSLFEKAFQDYHSVYNLKDHLPSEDQDFFSFWALIGEAISLSNQEEYALADIRIVEIEHSIQPLSWNYNSFPIPPVPPILGPDTVSPEWCEKCAQGLATSMTKYINLVQNENTRQRLLDIVRYLYTQAENCCKMSGFDPVRYNWKDCLGPLNQKRWLWKQKWELYKIPPDPSD